MAGVYEVQPGNYGLVLHEGPDPSMDVVLLPVATELTEPLESVKMDAVLLFSEQEQLLKAARCSAPASN